MTSKNTNKNLLRTLGAAFKFFPTAESQGSGSCCGATLESTMEMEMRSLLDDFIAMFKVEDGKCREKHAH
jgi:hypothetical protein